MKQTIQNIEKILKEEEFIEFYPSSYKNKLVHMKLYLNVFILGHRHNIVNIVLTKVPELSNLSEDDIIEKYIFGALETWPDARDLCDEQFLKTVEYKQYIDFIDAELEKEFGRQEKTK